MRIRSRSLAESLTLVLAIPAGLLLLALITPEQLDQGPNLCLWLNLVGRPCPGCGTTRALCSLVHGDVPRAIGYNRNVVLLAPLLVWIWLTQLRFLWRARHR